MRDFDEHNITEMAIERMAGAGDARLKEVMTSLVRHIHDFVRDVELTEAEWMTAIQFLTATGQKCDDKRQEFILLSDTMGVSMLVDAINNRKPASATQSTVLGPFYRPGARLFAAGESIAGDTPGEEVHVSGRVTDAGGRPIAGAILDVWQTAPNGLYEVQDPDQPEFNLRGKFSTDAEGRYALRTVKPVSYSVPDDGPVGQLMEALGRHTIRPAHIHFIVSAEGYEPVTTHLFTDGDPYIDSDVVFGVKSPLIVSYAPVQDAGEAAKLGITAPGWKVAYDFGLKAA
ncbi:MAG: intradiol ring-cleavage dioxygenase [Sneathiellaceae bacterium]